MDHPPVRLELANRAREAGLLSDIGIVSAQFYQGRGDAASAEPIKKLLTAILVDAVLRYRAGQRKILKGTEALKAGDWIFATHAEFPFSFTNVCAELGLSFDRTRLHSRDDEKEASAGGRPRMMRRPSIGRLKLHCRRGRSRRPSR